MSVDISWDWVPEYIRAWVYSLGWQEAEITAWKVNREILPDSIEVDSDGQEWRWWKLGAHWTWTIWRGQECHTQTFDLKLAQMMHQSGIQNTPEGR